MKHCVIIYNPVSGKRKSDAWFEKISTILLNRGYHTKIYKSEYAGHAKIIIQEIDSVDLVISIGGDGTLNEIVSGNLLRKKSLILSHLPYGSANDIGKMYGFGKNIFRNLQIILDGEVKEVDICTINDQPFIYVAGFGNFVPISYETPKQLKRKYGYFAYLIEGIRTLQKPLKKTSFQYQLDGKTYSSVTSFLLISNANRIAGINYFYQDVKLDDQLFEVLVCNLTEKKDILKSLYYLKTKGINHVPGCTTFKTNHLMITFDEVLQKFWCVDGECYKTDSLVYDIRLNHTISMLLPKKNIKQLFKEKE